MKRFIPFAAAVLFCAIPVISCGGGEEYHTGKLDFPEGASLSEKVELAARLVPEPRQLAWQENELTAFLHFGMNTFTGREWGDGSEDPALFAPSDIDCDQWAEILSSAGFRLAILTAKHHDGFCLWPSAVTGHTIAGSPYMDGKGDIVRDFADACRRHGLKVGLYLSPWDRNAPCYGDTPRYNEFYLAQLTELLTSYGQIDEIWLDGANGEGPDGRRQEYDWKAISETVRSLQPGAVLAVKGEDVRWVGNEDGLGRETEWSATVLAPALYDEVIGQNEALGIAEKSGDLGSRAVLEKAGSLFWYPSEVDVSIRPGWFYHEYEDSQVKSLERLSEIYFRSVGMNSSLLLNIPPDKSGRIAAADSVRLCEFGDWVRIMYSDNMLSGGKDVRLRKERPSAEYHVRPESKFNVVMLQEDISKGQRVESFKVETFDGNEWSEAASGTTIGYKRLLRIPLSEASRIRVTVTAARGDVYLKRPGLFFTE